MAMRKKMKKDCKKKTKKKELEKDRNSKIRVEKGEGR